MVTGAAYKGRNHRSVHLKRPAGFCVHWALAGGSLALSGNTTSDSRSADRRLRKSTEVSRRVGTEATAHSPGRSSPLPATRTRLNRRGGLAAAMLDIHEAAFNGDYRQLSIALDNGKDPCERDGRGTSSMHKAAANGHLACLQLLSERGGQLSLADVTGFTPLHVAARNGHLKTVKWLVEAGIDIKLQSKKGRTARDVAHAQGNFEVAKFLKEAGREKFDWEKADNYGKLNFVTK